MLTPKENYLRAIRYDNPEWVPSFTEDLNPFSAFVWAPDPETMIDFCNIHWIADTNIGGKMPDYSRCAMDSIEQWHDVVKWPDLAAIDWEKKAYDFFNGPRFKPDNAVTAMANTHGPFLTPINMMGWENALCDMMDEPEEYQAFVDAIFDFLVDYIGYLGKYIKPLTISTGDDICGNDGPFISFDQWRTMFRPGFERLCDAIHEVGAYAEFHCCGNCQYLVAEEFDMGYDISQLPIPNEQLLADKARLGRRMVMTGGWERHGDAGLPGASEEVVRASVRKAIDDYGKDGGLIFWDGGIILNTEDSKHKMEWLLDELHTYGRAVYAK